MRTFRPRQLASGLALLAIIVAICWAVADTIVEWRPERRPGEPTRLQDRIETQPVLSAVLLDRRSVILAKPARVRDDRGRVVTIVERPLGRPLAAAGVGRNIVVSVGIHGNLSDPIRADYEGVRPFERTSRVVRMLVGNPVLTAPDIPPITLTLDAEMSNRIYQLLPSQGRGASAVVIAAKTGELFAIVDTPGADVTRDAEPAGNESLWAFLSANLPASTMKLLTGAWILKNRPADASAAYDCDGDRCWTRHGRVAGLDDAIARSCNVWFRKVSRRIGPESWLQFLLAAGIAPIGIAGLPDSQLTVANRRPGQMQWPHAVGQQVWVSLVGLATAYASVTSATGRLRPPSVIAKVGDEQVAYAEGPEVVTPAVASRLRSILRKTATTGTATTVNETFRRRTASGKTGTGQVEGAASDAVFVALAPWDAPQWIVVVSIRRDGAGSEAGRVAGQILNLLPFGRTGAQSKTAAKRK